jgi:DNA invertase Pin-like site-specific DNA recombinase
MDDTSTSPQRQRQAIAKWCADREIKLVETFEDLDLSAFRKGVRRPGLERMLGRLGEANVVVTWRLDRLARSVSGFSKLLEAFEAADVKMATTDGQVDMTTAAGRAMVQMTAVFAELEAGTTSERVRGWHAHKRANGEWVGRVPFGFRRNGKGLEIDPEQFARLEEAARRYVGGESLRAIADDLGMYHPNLGRMLRSDRVVDALPAPLAGRLIEELAGRGRSGSRAQHSLLGGLARCGVCGAGMTMVADTRHREGRKDWAAYACRERRHVSISQPWLDEHVSSAVLDAIDTRKIVERLEKRKRPKNTKATSEIEARLELLERDFYERGIIARDSYLRRREGLLKRLQDARTADQDAGIDLPRELAEHLTERWPELTIQERRRIIVACVESITVTKATRRGPIDPNRVAIAWR